MPKKRQFNFTFKFEIFGVMFKCYFFRYSWYEGLSIFYVDSDGRICKHIADKVMYIQMHSIQWIYRWSFNLKNYLVYQVMPDEENSVDIMKTPVAAKLALLLGLVPKEQLLNLYTKKMANTIKDNLFPTKEINMQVK